MKKITLLIAFVLGITASYSQGIIEKSKVNGSFQIDGNYYWEDEGIGITADKINGETLGAYGFGKLQYQLGNFTAGMRFEAYQTTPMSGFDARVKGMGIANYFATYDNGTIGITVGDIYDQFGNGLIFRTYKVIDLINIVFYTIWQSLFVAYVVLPSSFCKPIFFANLFARHFNSVDD